MSNNGFRTKLDFSSNRQVKQRIETIQNLSGATTFGVPFNALPTGPDLTTTGVTETYLTVISTFSGNSGTTNYSWYDPRMNLGKINLSAITPSNSATTQHTGQVYTANTSTVIDGNTVILTYSGVSFGVNVTGMTNLGGGAYSGTVVTNSFNVLSAGTLYFTGRTIWNDTSGITRTDRLIVTRNPQIGYVLTCINSEGMGAWTSVSGVSADTNTYTTGSTLIGTTAYFNRNDVLSAYTLNLSTLMSNVWTAGTGNNSAVLSGSGSIASGNYSVAEGINTRASGYTSHSEGNGTTAIGESSHSEGSSTTASGATSHAEGNSTRANGVASHAEGQETQASGLYSHAEGNITQANGLASHAEGQNSIASGLYAHAEGNLTTALGQASHAEGQATKALEIGSHAEGVGTTATTQCTHAEGLYTKATGNQAHAEGEYTWASGFQSHAEGAYTTASGNASHSEGQNTIASGQYSHVEGSGTTASGVASHAGGVASHAGGTHSFIHSTNSTLTGNRSVMLGGNGMTGTVDDTVYTPNVVSIYGVSGGTFISVNNPTANYTELASSSTASTATVVGNINLARPYKLSGNSQTGFLGSYHVAYWDRDTAFNLTHPTSNLCGIDGAAYVNTSATTTLNRINCVRASLFSVLSGPTITEANYFLTNAPNETGMYGMQNVYGFHMEPHAGVSGFTAGTTNLWGVYINDANAKNYFGNNVWVGTTSGSESLDVNGNGRFRSIGSAASAGALHYTVSGTLTTNTSDERLKTNVVTITNALAKIIALRGVTYNWIESPNGDKRIGFIAQEVNSVVPELAFVNPNSPEQYMGVHYDNITALLVEAVKELSSGTTSNNTHLETQTILAEDNNIELNYSGSQQTAIGGGITVLHAKGENFGAELITNENGDWITNNDFKAKFLSIPLFTPTSTSDNTGNEGNITRDSDYLYVKTNSKWKRVKLEEF